MLELGLTGREMFPALVAALTLTGIAYFYRRWFFRIIGFTEHWNATFTSENRTKNKEEIELRSYPFGIVRGDSKCTWEESGKPISVTYKIWGRRKERTIIAIYVATDEQSLDRGVFIVNIRPGGMAGSGIITSYDSPEYQEFDFRHLDASKDYHWEKRVLKK